MLAAIYCVFCISAGIFKQSMGGKEPSRNGLSYRPATPHRHASIPGLLKSLKIRVSELITSPPFLVSLWVGSFHVDFINFFYN
jgi:hypothetical protein